MSDVVLTTYISHNLGIDFGKYFGQPKIILNLICFVGGEEEIL